MWAADATVSVQAGKHTAAELRTLQSLLETTETNFLDRRGKIVATLGPASSNREMIRKLIAAGVDVFRLNASHRRPGQFEELIPAIRDEAKAAGRDVKILGDIQGPKFRCSLTVDDVPVPLAKGEVLEFALAEHDGDLTRPGASPPPARREPAASASEGPLCPLRSPWLCARARACSPRPRVEHEPARRCATGRITLTPTTEQTALVNGVTEGMQLLLDDGFMEVTVKQRVSPSCVLVEVVVGGGLKSRKGINVPELQIDCSALTVKDREDAAYLLSMGVDYIALSFAQTASDLQELIDLMDAEGIAPEARPWIIPKIEKPSALRNIDEILALSGGMMVARGDLGVELGLHRVPFAQKFLIRKCNAAGKFCITATQMMESMITNAVPTRAEVSDVANAVFDGTDAVMLSGESAMGADPVGTVQWMGRIISEAEAHTDDVTPSF